RAGDLRPLRDQCAAGTDRPGCVAGRGLRGRPMLRGAGVGLTAKIAAGAVVAVMAAGATTEAVITRSANPVDWARHVTQQAQPAPTSHQSSTSPAASTAQSSPKAATSPVVSPVVSAPALPSATPPAVPTLTTLP